MKIILLIFSLLVSVYSFCQYDAIKSKGIYSSSFVIDEKPRNITYYMPSNYGNKENYPLLIILPSDKSDAASIIKKYGEQLQAKADSADCIILFPDVYKGHWNIDLKDTVNDVGFINIMAEFFLRQFNCDLSEIRLLGIGSGGNLCYRFACESIYQPVAIVTINVTAGNETFSNCREKIKAPYKNIEKAGFTKADIKQAIDFLFANQHLAN